jgi:hypothetical protein
VIHELRDDPAFNSLCSVAMSAGYQLRELSRSDLNADARRRQKSFERDALYAAMEHCLRRGG